MKQLLSHFATDLVSAIKPAPEGAVRPSVQRLLRQTAYKLAQNEFQEWGKLLMNRRAASAAAPGKKIALGAAKKTAVVAVVAGVAYYWLKRR
jgi:hypothetical protein